MLCSGGSVSVLPRARQGHTQAPGLPDRVSAGSHCLLANPTSRLWCGSTRVKTNETERSHVSPVPLGREDPERHDKVVSQNKLERNRGLVETNLRVIVCQ